MEKWNDLADRDQATADLCESVGVDATGDVAGRIERVSAALGLTFSRERNDNGEGWDAIRAHLSGVAAESED